MPQRIELITFDDVRIVGNWVTAPTTIGAVILLHMYPATKESWAAFQAVLARRGLASLAIDLRGHGESNVMTDGTKLDYETFTEDEHRSTVNDIYAAHAWIRERDIDSDSIALAGASIGANLALKFLMEEPEIPAAVLLSPGLNYHGIDTMQFVDYVMPHQSVHIVASKGDDDESVKASNELMKLLSSEVKMFTKLDNAGHGTDIFEADVELMGQLADWLRDRIQRVELPA